MYNARRSDYDVTNTVRVSSVPDVRDAVQSLFELTWPQASFEPVARAFYDFAELFAGRMPGYFGVDTVYHDQQHTLDVTLALARLMSGYETMHRDTDMALGPERAVVGMVLGLFHDVGYLRETSEQERNGAEFTRNHVSRSARFIERYLQAAGFAPLAPVAREIVHFTGYERPFAHIDVSDPRDLKLGHLLGTADMIAQMADRCYLEKCRDRLYPEFVLGGVALPIASNGGHDVKYASGLDLLRQTPEFIDETRRKRLDLAFEQAYRYIEVLYNGENPYIESIDRSLAYLRQVLRSESWRMLRRSPQVYAAQPDTLANVRGLMVGYFKKVWSEN
jgi:hypothetical protein